MNKVKVLVKLPGEYPEVREIEPTYEAVRDIIGGWLEVIPCTPQKDRGIIYYCDEEGKLRDLASNIALVDGEGHVFDIIVGPIVVVKYNMDDWMESMTSLSKDEIALHKNWLDVRGV